MHTLTHRPRNIDAVRAGSILYGDWGTSKAYVIGLAFAVSGYASFWLLAAVCILSILVGINYLTICRYYPSGGGVYASVRHRSQIISMVGAFFLVADYLVTASISALSAFYYFGAHHPVIYAIVALFIIGALNYLGPRHTGSLAFWIGILVVSILIILALFSLPYLKTAWHNIQPFRGGPTKFWVDFMNVIVGLSGIEAIANITGVMKLNRGAKNSKPLVTKTSTPAILTVMIEVVFFTALFGFVVAAIQGFTFANDTVDAPGNPNVRDYMLRYITEVFVGNVWGTHVGLVAGWIVSIAFGVLLLSAVNTAFNGLIALQYVMAADNELPDVFRKLNRFGVPLVPLLLATVIPIFLLMIVGDISKLAALYAIGFVGAIATNLGATSTNFKLGLKAWERGLMFFSFALLVIIEITLFVTKAHARNYAIAVILVGLLLRGLSKEFKLKNILKKGPLMIPKETEEVSEEVVPTSESAILCPVTNVGKTLQTALDRATKRKCPLNILFLREQNVISELDDLKSWKDDPGALKVYSYATKKGAPEQIHFYYCITDAKAATIVDFAKKLNVNEVIMSMSKKGPLLQMIKGDNVREVAKELPAEIRMFIIP